MVKISYDSFEVIIHKRKGMRVFFLFMLFFGDTDETPVYTQVTSKCRIQLQLETSLSKAFIENNAYSAEYA